jgi:hypothetical protein
MKLLSLTSVLGCSAVTLATILIPNEPASSQQATTTFVCGTNQGSPATIVQTSQHGDVPIITWNSGFFEGSGFDNQTRCDLVSKKFQDFYNQGNLKYFTAGSANKQPIVCVVPSTDSPCNSDSQLFTLKPESNAEETLKQLFDIRKGASPEGLNENNNVSANDRTYLSFEEVLQNKANEAKVSGGESSSVGESQVDSPDNPIF